MVRAGGVSLILGGLFGIAAALLVAWLFAREVRPSTVYDSVGWLWMVTDVVALSGELFVTVGLVGVYALLAERRGSVGVLAKVGILLALASTVGYVVLWAREYLFVSTYNPSGGLFIVGAVSSAYVRPVGMLLLGVATLWVQELGRWRWLLIAIALGSTPLPDFLLYYLVSPETPPADAAGILFAGQIPRVLVDLGCIALGFAMWGVGNRGDVLLAGDRRLREQRNLDRARRLYTETWGEGNFAALEELVSPDVVDHGRGERGRENFKRGVADLRRSFPDLRFEIEDQSADGDEVVTRWEMTGTDRGGVLWYPPTNEEATFTGTFTDRFSGGGRVVEHRQQTDTNGLLGQLGLPCSD